MYRKTLEKLLEGNRNFANGNPIAINKCLKTLQSFAHHQEPHAIVLSCSDSRVVPEIIFDCGIGELFVVRTAGIGLGDNVIESIEYGVDSLKLPLLILIGHDNCGVMKYAVNSYKREKKYNALMSTVVPLLDDSPSCHNNLAKRHTVFVKETLLEKSHIIRQAYEDKELKIVQTHFNFETGLIELL